MRITPLIIASFATLATATTVLRPANAIIQYGSQRRAITAPTGAYADSGWQHTGLILNSSIAWPISPNWALQAQHTTGGNQLGNLITLNGVEHTIVESVQYPGSDLALVRVDNPFATWAPMYDGSDEQGRETMVIGRGFNVKDQPIISLGGHDVGHTLKNADEDGDHVLAWGRNAVAETKIINVGGVIGDTLYMTYDKPKLDDGSPNPNSVGGEEATAGFGDSGGGIFIQQGGQWRLAGVIWAIDAGIFYDETAGGPYLGAISDYRDMWVDNGKGGREYVDGPDPIGAGFYATRVSTYRDFIDTTTKQTRGIGATVVPEAGTGLLAVLGVGCLALGTTLARRRARVAS